MLSYDLSKRGEQSRYEYLYQCIRDDILSGDIGPGERLPSKRRLAEHLGVGLVTVESAYSQLVAEGYVLSRERRGYFAASLPKAPAAGPVPAHAFAGGEAAVATGLPHVATDGNVPLVADLSHPSHVAEPAAALWGRSIRAALAQEPTEQLFGPIPGNGSSRLRAAIARYLARTRGLSADPSCVVVGAGAQVLYNFIVQLLGRRRTYAVEDPGYPRLTSIYLSNACDLRFVPLDKEGVSVRALAASGASVVHLMPSHQFPTGRVTSVSRRYEVLGWANQEPNRYVVEDDYDCEFRLAGRPIPSLASMDASGRVIYVGTFSKSLSPALRMAYVVLPPVLMDQARKRLGFYSTTVSALEQVTLARLLESGDYERHVNRHRKRMRDVRDALVGALMRDEPSGTHVEEGDSGLHFVLRIDAQAASALTASDVSAMPSDSAAVEKNIVALALSAGVRLAPLSDFCHDRHCLPADGAARFVVQYDGLDLDTARRAGQVLNGVLAGTVQTSHEMLNHTIS